LFLRGISMQRLPIQLNKTSLFALFLLAAIELNFLSPITAFAQTTGSESAQQQQDRTLPLGSSPQLFTQFPSLAPQLSFTDNQSLPTQPHLRTSPVVQKLAKKFYRSDEDVHVAILNPQDNAFHVSVVDPKGKQADVAVQQAVTSTNQVAFDISPRVEFHPGKYRLLLTDQDGRRSEQDFTWGVLALNMDRSIYTKGQTTHFSIAVLDDQGNMVCNAKVSLAITNDTLGVHDTLSTDNGKISVNRECQSHNFTLKPDYEAQYTASNSGTFALNLTATTTKDYSITDQLIVKDTVPFDVQRVSATRIYPPNNYPMQFNITANQDFTGTITETVPDDFTITSSQDLNSYDNMQTVYLDSKTDPERRLAANLTEQTKLLGTSSVLGASTSALLLPFAGTFPITEGFGAEQTDPSLRSFYQQFALAGHDGVDFGVPIGTTIRSVDEGNVVLAGPGDYGITVVIQHSWGKSYYGHLSQVLTGVGQHVSRGQTIGLSGETGEATGPHLHFGMKPEQPDMSNGYFGKVDPLPYFSLPSNAAIADGSAPTLLAKTLPALTSEPQTEVLGASTSAAAASSAASLIMTPTPALPTSPQTVAEEAQTVDTSTLTKQVRSQILALPETPVSKVKVLSWNVSLKKGESLTIGYTFKTPQVSPQFYLLGPLTFIPKQGNTLGTPVFQEARQWQIAADAVGAAWYDYNWQYRKQITIDHTKIGQPSLDAQTNKTGGAVSSISWSHTTGTQSNRLLVVSVATYNSGVAAASVNSITYNGTALSPVPNAQRSAPNKIREELWYLVAPASGANTIVVNLSGSGTGVTAESETFYEVDQNNPFGTAATNNGTSSAASVSVTNVTANQLVIEGMASSGTTESVSGGQTQLWNVVANGFTGAGSDKSGTGTVAISWSSTTGDQWDDVAVPINGSLQDFPVVINLASDTDLKNNAQSSGNDIVFTDSTGQTKLSHEIETYNSTGNGDLIAWVKVPALASGTDTILYMYYGNAAASNQQNVADVWSNGYVGVWHMDEAATPLVDSTGIAGNANATGSPGYGASGPIGTAVSFNGTNGNKFVVTESSNIEFGTSSFSYSYWVYAAAKPSGFYDYIYKGGTSTSDAGFASYINSNPCIFVKVSNGTGTATQASCAVNNATATWYYAVATVDRTANSLKYYQNGSINQTSALFVSGSVSHPVKNLYFGGDDTGNPANGRMEEVHLQTGVRTPGWILTEYNNQNSPATFYSLSSTVETKIYAPTLDQLMRHGKWFCPTTSINDGTSCSSNTGEQPYVF
jgi:murein DD-endopeptidase MepM/ murein hydrolase activator NlpD